MCSGSEAGSYLRPIDSCITQIKAQGPSSTCNESKEEEEGVVEPQTPNPTQHRGTTAASDAGVWLTLDPS